MSENFFFYDERVLKLYFELIDEYIHELAQEEWNRSFCELRPQQRNPKLSIFKLCNPFWVTYIILQGIFKFLFCNNRKVVVVNTPPIKYIAVNNSSDEDSDESEMAQLLRLQPRLSKETQTDRRDLERPAVESALADLINLRKFREIVPANRKALKRTFSEANPFRKIDERNRFRYGGKVIKPKLKMTSSSVFCRPKTDGHDPFKVVSVHDVLNHLLYMESSDDEP